MHKNGGIQVGWGRSERRWHPTAGLQQDHGVKGLKELYAGLVDGH